MRLLYYNELDTSKVKRQFKKVEKYLEKGDFKSADVKKMQKGYYRAKLDRENRLLFRFAQYNNESYLLLLEVIHNHEYEKSKFLNGASVNENKLPDLPTEKDVPKKDIKQLIYINHKRKHFHLLDKIISFDDDQFEIYGLPAPLVIIGSAGSGKTALTLEKMKFFKGKVLYISLSPYLVENAQRIYYSFEYDNSGQEVDFMSFQEYLQSIKIPKGREVVFKDFEAWYSRYQQTFKFKEPYKLFEEFKGVLTGSVIDKPYLSREEYINLGVRQSIFLDREREKVYDLFEKYLDFLEERSLYDANITSYNYLTKVEPQYNFVVVDEVQDITNIQLTLILKSLEQPSNFVLSGDSNQIVHPNFFSWSKIKSLFFNKDLRGNLLRILKTNYRNSKNITVLSNELLKIKNARFGSIDKESTYLIDTVSSVKGEVNFFEENDKIKKELNQKTQGSTKFAVLVMDNREKSIARGYFKTPLIFSIHEAKGLEYDNIILLNFLSNYDKEFREITSGVTREDILDENMRYGRARDKTNKELEAYKFYINSLYVAFTRAVKNLYIIEKTKKHDILKLLNIVEPTKKLVLEQQQSNEEEWLEEARRLELQGKHEQAAQIRARIKGIEYISPDEAERLANEIFNSDKPSNAQCQRLFNYAKARNLTSIIERLQKEARFGPAKQYMGEYNKAQKIFFTQCRNGNLRQVEKITQKFGMDIKDNREGMTGLMLGVLYDKSNLIDYFLKNEAKLTATDDKNRNALQMAMLAYEHRRIDKKRLQNLYLQFRRPYIKCISDGKMRKISFKSMEYFLINYLYAIRDEIINPKDPPSMQGLKMDEFMEYIELMPDGILPAYRRKRQYVNSILAKNEIDRDDKYNRKLFKRKSRGVYNFYEGLEVIYE